MSKARSSLEEGQIGQRKQGKRSLDQYPEECGVVRSNVEDGCWPFMLPHLNSRKNYCSPDPRSTREERLLNSPFPTFFKLKNQGFVNLEDATSLNDFNDQTSDNSLGAQFHVKVKWVRFLLQNKGFYELQNRELKLN